MDDMGTRTSFAESCHFVEYSSRNLGVFSNKGYLLNQVCVDTNEDIDDTVQRVTETKELLPFILLEAPQLEPR